MFFCARLTLTISQKPKEQRIYIQYMTPEDATLDNEELTADARWSYYVTSYTMRDATEGVNFPRMRMPFLKRNMPAKVDSEEVRNKFFKPLVADENLVLRIDPVRYAIQYEPGSSEWWYRDASLQLDSQESGSERTPSEAFAAASDQAAVVHEKRRDKFIEKHVNNPAWMRQMSKDEVDQINQRFRSWVGEASVAKRESVETDTTPADTTPADASPAATPADATPAEVPAAAADTPTTAPKSGDGDGDDTEMAEAT